MIKKPRKPAKAKKPERDIALIKDYRSRKYRLWELSAKYGIAHSTLFDILDTYGVQRNTSKKN